VTLTGQPIAVLGLVGAAIAGVGIVGGWLVSRLTRWRPAGGLFLLAVTPFAPHVDIGYGLSLDDFLPLSGLAFLLVTVRLSDLRRIRPPLIATIGLALLVFAAALSSIVNGVGPSSALTMILRSAGRDLLLAAIVVLVAATGPADRRRSIVATSMAGMGTAEAILGLAGFLLPLGGIFLEPVRKYSVLYLEVPGRLAGTLGISPNFLGAIFILTILLAAGLALEADDRRRRFIWWSSVVVQFLALTLTFTRASLALAIVAVAALLLVGRRPRVFVPIAIVIAVTSVATPALARLTGDVPDRLALWTSSARMMVDHPIAGVGPGQTVNVAQSDPSRYVQTEFGPATNSAHNTILYAGAETGVLGAIGSALVNLGLALAAIKVLISARRRGAWLPASAAIAIFGYLAQGMVNNLFSVAVAGEVFALVVGAFLIEQRLDGWSRSAAAPTGREAPDTAGTQRQRAPMGPPVELTVYTPDVGPIYRKSGFPSIVDRNPGFVRRHPVPRVVVRLLLRIPRVHK
jgi:O-antigen ligase